LDFFMAHPAQITRADNEALRKEIGERLGRNLDLKPAGMPPRLAMLVTQWRHQLSNRPLTCCRTQSSDDADRA
jgi:hypothetical protein